MGPIRNKLACTGVRPDLNAGVELMMDTAIPDQRSSGSSVIICNVHPQKLSEISGKVGLLF